MNTDTHIDIDIIRYRGRGKYRCRYFGCLKGGSKSVQVLFIGIEAVVVLTFIWVRPGSGPRGHFQGSLLKPSEPGDQHLSRLM